MLKQKRTSPLQKVNEQLFDKYKVNVYIKRDDLIHPEISGNKWRKLKHNINQVEIDKKSLFISFGGAYSNHIHALAKAGQEYGFQTLGIIRGEYDPDNPTIQFAQQCGMQLKFVTRLEYKRRNSQEYTKTLTDTYPNCVILPEGGTNQLALAGFSDLINEIPRDKADYIICPCGSGGTTAGLLEHSKPNQTIISIAVLKQAQYIKQDVLRLSTKNHENLAFFDNFHQGGYGKINPLLLDTIKQFYKNHNILFEPIYSGKMLMAFYDLLNQGYFKEGSSVTLLHTGGLQGLNGMRQRGLIPPHWPND